MSYLRFKQDGDRTKLASVMANDDFQGGKMGEMLAEGAFREQQRLGVPIYAECDPRSGITQKYLEWGFVGLSAGEERGLKIFNIEWRGSRNAPLATTLEKMTRDEVMRRSQEAPDASRKTVFLTCPAPKEGAQTVSLPEVERLLADGYMLTRYFTEKGTHYSVLERP